MKRIMGKINMEVVWFLLDIFILYLVIMAAVYFLSNSMMFKPPTTSYKDDEEIIKLTTKNNKKISAIYMHNPDAKYTILYSHGNATDLGYLHTTLERYVRKGFSILAYDYQGYGTSEGYPSEKATYLDIQAAYDYLTKQKNISPNHIIALGRSLGSGPTLELAKNNKLAGVILESPFYTAFRVKTGIPIFPVDKYRNNRKIRKIYIPVLIIHGSQDRTIPLWHSEKLYEIANVPKKLVVVDNGSHNDIHEIMSDDYWKELEVFTKTLDKKY